MIESFRNITENKLIIKNEYLDSVLNEIFLGDLRIYYVNHNVKKYRIYHPSGNYPSILMNFTLNGTNAGRSNITGESYRIEASRHNLVYFPHTNMDFTIESSTAQFFGIQFSENFFYGFVDNSSIILCEFWEKVEKKEEAFLVKNKCFYTTPNMKSAISDIMNSNKKGYLKKLYLESKIIEILMLLLEQAESYSKVYISVSKSDKEKLHAVKELIEQNLLQQFSLREFSFSVGLNEFKLKMGFRELFGRTVFGYINELRMDYAKKLILNENRSIAEVADSLGYSEPHHFSYAFKRKFGFSPGVLK